MYQGALYSNVRKVYSINIVYFELGGDDYVYHGLTHFKGLHTNTELQLTTAQQQLYNKTVIGEICPEYYIIKVRGFDDVAKNTLDEWIYYLKNNKIEDHFTAKGLSKAKELFLFDNLSAAEKERYLCTVDNKLLSDDAIQTALLEGKIKGEAIGLEKGEAIGLEKGEAIGLEKGEAIGLEKGELKKAITVARKALEMEMSAEDASKLSGLSIQQIKNIYETHSH
jgi:predicted transposase YdaD